MSFIILEDKFKNRSYQLAIYILARCQIDTLVNATKGVYKKDKYVQF